MLIEKIPLTVPWTGDQEVLAAAEVIRSGWLTQGPKTTEFEKTVADYVGAAGAVATTSCTTALALALMVSGVQAGDEVITSPYSFIATANSIMAVGARPVFADIDRRTLMVTPDTVRPCITGRTKVTIPVHYAGAPVDLDPLREMALESGLTLIEDAAHALGTRYKGEPIGKSGTAIFSFHPIKNITTGEGGMAVTDKAELADRIRQMSLHGLSHDAWRRYSGRAAWDYRIMAPGFKYNLTDIASAMGLAQLRKAERMWLRRREIAWRYKQAFAGIPELQIPADDDTCQHAWQLYILRLNLDQVNISRSHFIDIHWVQLPPFVAARRLTPARAIGSFSL